MEMCKCIIGVALNEYRGVSDHIVMMEHIKHGWYVSLGKCSTGVEGIKQM